MNALINVLTSDKRNLLSPRDTEVKNAGVPVQGSSQCVMENGQQVLNVSAPEVSVRAKQAQRRGIREAIL